MRKYTLLLAGVLAASCARPEYLLYPIRDSKGRPVKPDPNSCKASVDARRYVYEIRQRVFEAWQPPQGHHG